MDGRVEKLEQELISTRATLASEAMFRRTSSSLTAFSFLTACDLVRRWIDLVLCSLICPLYAWLLRKGTDGGKPKRTVAASSMLSRRILGSPEAAPYSF